MCGSWYVRISPQSLQSPLSRSLRGKVGRKGWSNEVVVHVAIFSPRAAAGNTAPTLGALPLSVSGAIVEPRASRQVPPREHKRE